MVHSIYLHHSFKVCEYFSIVVFFSPEALTRSFGHFSLKCDQSNEKQN